MFLVINKDEFKNFATDDITSEEFVLRNKASRLYYHLFHSIKEFLPMEPRHNEKGGSHKKISNCLAKDFLHLPNKMDYVRLAILMNKCKDIRTEADYKLDEDFNLSSFELLAKESDKALQLIKEIEPSAA
jgi:uncharacterized protein (UPF0332 family)